MVVKTVVEAQDIFDKAWEGFQGEDWKERASVSRFVQDNYTPYDGDESFLAGPTERSLHIKKIVEETKAHYEETRFPYDTRPTSIADIAAGYIDKENEVIFGIQNDELFKLNFMPRGGIRMAGFHVSGGTLDTDGCSGFSCTGLSPSSVGLPIGLRTSCGTDRLFLLYFS